MNLMTKIAQQAEVLCAEMLHRIAAPTKYIAGFSTRLGRQLALQRTQQSIYCWTEEVALAGAPISPIRLYAANERRNSNLNAKNCPNLKVGNSLHYWKFADTTSFQDFLNWYDQRPQSSGHR